jgi:hypothetical protein
LGSDELLITDGAGLTINGRKAKIKVSGNDAVRVFRVEPGAVFALRNLTVADGNTSFFGAGLLNNGGEVQVWNSTFSGNSATINGGGIFNFGGGTATLKNTIVANSTQGGNCDGFAPITDGGYNIEDADTCGVSAANNSLPSTDPKLASSLAKNGGPTMTIALLKGSPALNAIPQATNGCGTDVTTDQRGVKRPQGSGCDIGAFEKKVRRR